MAQHDYNIANAGGATVRADMNNVLAAVQSLNSGTGAPSSTVAGMLWLDTSGGLPYALKIRDGGNNHWLTIASVTDPGSDGNIETSATIKGTIDPTASFPTKSANTGNTSAGGHILQVQHLVKSDEFSSSSPVNQTVVQVTGFQIKITPSSTSSKVLVCYHMNVSQSSGAHTGIATILYKDGSAISDAIPSTATGVQTNVTTGTITAPADGNAYNGIVSFSYLDSPNTQSEITYDPRIFQASGSAFTAHVNRPQNTTNFGYITRTISTLTAMEIA